MSSPPTGINSISRGARSPMPQIEVKTKQGRRRFELTDKPISVGRADDNTLVIKDTQASRHHCVIEPTSDGFRIRDLDSRNGTTLNK
ncbi:MAG: FHA domain-containing protein, partial [Phycisphaerae bacterium]|nr:FHA domain-containing protein [Phycisphaerae bacterium]